MATPKGFQNLASKLLNKTFVSFQKVVVLTQYGDTDYDTQVASVIATDTTKGTRTEYAASLIDNQNIQQGDYKILVEVQGLNVNVRADNVDMTFDGVAINIVSCSQDAANAVYTIQARAK